MPIKISSYGPHFYIAICDKCQAGEPFHNKTDCFADLGDYFNWLKLDDGKILCRDCKKDYYANNCQIEFDFDGLVKDDKDKDMSFIDGKNVPTVDICPNCGTVGEIANGGCKCPNCWKILWG